MIKSKSQGELAKGFPPTLFLLKSKRDGAPPEKIKVKLDFMQVPCEINLTHEQIQHGQTLWEQGLDRYLLFCLEFTPCGKYGILFKYPQFQAVVSELDNVQAQAEYLDMDLIEL